MKTNDLGISLWEGYTLQQLYSRRTATDRRLLIESCRLADETALLRSKISSPKHPKTLIGRMFSAIDYADWIILGIGLWRRVSPFFRRK